MPSWYTATVSVFLAINIIALIAFTVVCIIRKDEFAFYENGAKQILYHAIEQGGATLTRLSQDISKDFENARDIIFRNVFKGVNTGAPIPVELEPCKEGYHNDGLTCRKPIKCHGFIKCSGGQIYGRLNKGGCCQCDRRWHETACFKDCPCGYFSFSSIAWVIPRFCIYDVDKRCKKNQITQGIY